MAADGRHDTAIGRQESGRTYRSLSSDVGAADDLRPGQRLLPLGSLPQGDQGRHVWGRKADYVQEERT